MHEPLRVFLDSSDYSVLSDPKRAGAESDAILRELLALRDKGAVKYFYSGTVLLEVMPTSHTALAAAQRRVELLVQLCDRNALAWHYSILQREVALARGKEADIGGPYSDNGDWFPPGTLNLLPSDRIDVKAEVERAIMNGAQPRADRRRAVRALRKSKLLLAEAKAAAAEPGRSAELDALIGRLPLRPEDERTVRRFLCGDTATAEEATNALRESLRDPRGLMQWIALRPDAAGEFVRGLREPAMSAAAQMMEGFELASRLRSNPLLTGSIDGILSKAKWEGVRDQVVGNLTAQLAGIETRSTPWKSGTTHLPVLSMVVGALFSAWWTSISQTPPRAPKPSDFVDAMHCTYAPYVDVFRADSFMAPHIQRQVGESGTVVVPKLSGLLKAIDMALAC